jgi:predicted RNase H-like HicB family nuclease
MEYSYTVLFEPAEEGGYVAFCPALPGLVTEGDTSEEARGRVKEAIKGYLESLQKTVYRSLLIRSSHSNLSRKRSKLPFLNLHEPAVAGSEARENSQGSPKSRVLCPSHQGFALLPETSSQKHPANTGLRVTLPFHNADLKRRTLMSIVEQAGFSIEEFLELL